MPTGVPLDRGTASEGLHGNPVWGPWSPPFCVTLSDLPGSLPSPQTGVLLRVRQMRGEVNGGLEGQ